MIHHDPDGPVLVLSPHLDDALLDCFTQLQATGTVVVNIFAGLPEPGILTWWDRLCGGTSSQEMVRARREEDRRALAIAGAGEPEFLDLLDAQYRLRSSPLFHWALHRMGRARAVVLRPAPAQRLLRAAPPATPTEVLALLAARHPTASRVMAPAGIGRHPDHLVVRAAAIAIANAGVPVQLFADLPYAVRFGWPGWVSGDDHPDGRAAARWETDLRDAPIVGPIDGASVHTLTAEQLATKAKAAQAYTTQFGNAQSGLPELMMDRETLLHEVYWTVRS